MYDDQFDARHAEAKVREYRRKGPTGSTTRLIDGLAAGGVGGLTVLDIGAGVGAVHHALLAAGAASAIDVDASGAYLAAARREADRRGVADLVSYLKGDAVALAPEIPAVDLVALDRVVCCYPDMEALVGVAADRTRRRLGIVMPRDDAWIRAAAEIGNRLSAIRRNAFRVHAHRTAEVLRVTAARGLVPVRNHRGGLWQTLILERPAG